MNVRRTGVAWFAVAAAAVPAVLLTGCATTTTTGHAAGPAPTTSSTTSPAGGACAQSGTSADAARGTVRCYLNALAVSDTDTACAALSSRVRTEIATRATSSDTNNVYKVPGVGDSSCATVAPLMRRALEQLPAAERAALASALRGADVGAVDVHGSAATVHVTITADGRTGAQGVALVQDAGSWKIDSASAFATGS